MSEKRHVRDIYIYILYTWYILYTYTYTYTWYILLLQSSCTSSIFAADACPMFSPKVFPLAPVVPTPTSSQHQTRNPTKTTQTINARLGARHIGMIIRQPHFGQNVKTQQIRQSNYSNISPSPPSLLPRPLYRVELD